MNEDGSGTCTSCGTYFKDGEGGECEGCFEPTCYGCLSTDNFCPTCVEGDGEGYGYY